MDDAADLDRTKIRLGIAIVALVEIAAVVMFIVVESPAGKAVMFAIGVTAFIRMYLLTRSVRRA